MSTRESAKGITQAIEELILKTEAKEKRQKCYVTETVCLQWCPGEGPGP